ncbi:MAG TPA: 3-oxoacyl-ACP reductase family protein [Polyangiaceae bacterium]|nr:3-oxoacyl-ACP reductase family protein [Polyangiaceae bacterium]
MFSLAGKVALVTGASRGIGSATVKTLAAQGAYVVVGYVRGEEAAQRTLAEIIEAGGKGEIARIDAADFAGSETAVTELAKRLGRLDILVVSAGISIDALMLRLKEEDFDTILNVNLKGAVAAAKAALKVMMKQRAGRIVFLSSVVGEAGNAGQTAYAASKAALLGVTKSLAKEYAGRNVTVNAVTPGYIATDMTAALTDEQRAAMLTGVPLGRPGEPREIAATVAFLASDEAGYITGQTLRVNGGMYM